MAQANKVKKANVLPVFIWQGTNKKGAKVKGEQSAESINMVKAQLRQQGHYSFKSKEKAQRFIRRKKTSD